MNFPELEHHTLLKGLTPPPEYFRRPQPLYSLKWYADVRDGKLEFEPIEPVQLLVIDNSLYEILGGVRESEQVEQANANTEADTKIDDAPAKKQSKTLRFDPVFEVRTYDVAGAPTDVHNNLSTFRNNPTLGELPGRDLNPRSSVSNIYASFAAKKKKEEEAKAAAAAFFRDVYPTFEKMPLVSDVSTPPAVISFDKENAVVPDTPLRLKKRVKRRTMVDRFRQVNSNNNRGLTAGLNATNIVAPANSSTYITPAVIKSLDFSAFSVLDSKNLAAAASATTAPKRLSGMKRGTAEEPTGASAAKRVCTRDVGFSFSISSTTPADEDTFIAMEIGEEENVLLGPAPATSTAAKNHSPAPRKATSRKNTRAPTKTNTSPSQPASNKKVGKPAVKKIAQGAATSPVKSAPSAWSGRLRTRKAAVVKG